MSEEQLEKKNDFNFERSNRAHAKCEAAWSGRRRSQHLHAAGCFLPIPLAFRWKREMYNCPSPTRLAISRLTTFPQQWLQCEADEKRHHANKE